MSSDDCIKKEKVYNTEEFDEFLDRCDKRMKKYFEIEKKNIEMGRKYLKLKKKYDKLMSDFDDFFKFYVKKVDKEREKLYNIKYDRLFSIKQNGIINNQPSQLVKEDEMCSTSYNTGGRSNSGEWVSFDFDDSVENLQKFIERGVGLGGFNFGYHRLEYNKVIDLFLEFHSDEKLIGCYSFNTGFNEGSMNHVLFYTNYGNILYLYSERVEARVWNYKAFVEKLDFKIPPVFINLINTVVLNSGVFDSGKYENTEQKREGKPTMSFNSLVNFLKQIKYITEN